MALTAILALPLAGCTASGSSTFANSVLSDSSLRSSQESTEAVPLNVASTESAAAADSEPQQLASLAESDNGREPADLNALAPVEEKRPTAARWQVMTPGPQATATNAAPVQTASLFTVPLATPRMNAVPLAADDATGEVEIDPAEAAAQERIPALFASIDHGQCKGGWGPKPQMVNAKRMTPGQPYYMEMRLRHTPPLPVGHVYIAYGRLSPDGQPMDEKLVMLAPMGGYSGAAVAAAVPMPGVLKPYGDDCVLRPIAAYRVSLTAQQFEKLLTEIERQKVKKPAYALFAYNCNHFMSDVAKSVGILPPKNIYTPSLQYFYEMMDRNEGHRVARTADELKLASAE